MDRLIVKNFGPLKDVDIQLNKINLFIGENGSGKSVLAKLITIILDFANNIEQEKVEQKFRNFNIDFLEKNTLLQLQSGEEIIFEYKDERLYLNTADKFKKLDNDSKLNFKQLDKTTKILNDFANEETIGRDKVKELLQKAEDVHTEQNRIKIETLKFSSQYIPAERNLISLFNRYVTTFITAEIPLPKFLLNFSSQYTKAREEIQKLNFLNVEYRLKNGQEHIFYTGEKSLLLEDSSSGIQSALPLYLTVKYFAGKHRGIIIEEPEQNLFPKAQAETIQYIIEQISNDNNLFLMTHSPYVLSTLNILMMAHKAGKLNVEAKKEVTKLFNENQWIDPDDFSAYFLEDGIARDIKGETGLMADNEIDEISDDIQSDFEELLSIYREHKNDK